MDGLIKRFESVQDRDLMLCPERGVAYQRDMSVLVDYDDAYFDRYVEREGKEIARKLNAGRVDLVNRHAGAAAIVCDIGVGSGEFIKSRPNTVGHDVNPKALIWLAQQRKASGQIDQYRAFTFWDVLEHIPDPNGYFKRIPEGSYLFTCLPVMSDLKRIRESRHYKPGEHLYYFTEPGFIDWMALYRFRFLERLDFETRAGRDQVTSFAFKRDLPGYHETIAQYQEMHSRFYGASAYIHFEPIAKEVLLLNPGSILDYGCGRSDLVAHFWDDGARRIVKYDPAIPQWKDMPEGTVDLVLCTDVMEHIPMTDIERVFTEIKAKSSRALFTISLRPARAHLPDGRNAHVTLLNAGEWLDWIKSMFGRAQRVPLQFDHLLMAKTF